MAGIGLAAGAAVPLLAPAPAQTMAHVAIALSMVLGISAVRLAQHTSEHGGELAAGGLPAGLHLRGGHHAGHCRPAALRALDAADAAAGGRLEAPFNLHGLRLLEERRAQVHTSLRALHVEADGESREELKRRLDLPPQAGPPAATPAARCCCCASRGWRPAPAPGGRWTAWPPRTTCTR